MGPLATTHTCQPRIVTAEGADHTGLDAWMGCCCGKRTEAYVECGEVDHHVILTLRLEWDKERIAERGAAR